MTVVTIKSLTVRNDQKLFESGLKIWYHLLLVLMYSTKKSI